jgi:hypothetical protein
VSEFQANDPDCLAFLLGKDPKSGATIDPLKTLGDILNLSLFGHADISQNGNPNIIGAVSSGGVPGQAITVNNQGAFFLSGVGDSPLTVGPNHIPGGTAQAQGFILLHELGHLTFVLRPDAGVPKAGRKNDNDIQKHCEKTINSFAR